VSGLEAMLSTSVRALSDGGGEYHAAHVPILGPKKVAAFLMGVTHKRGVPDWVEIRLVNGLPAIVAGYQSAKGKDAPLAVTRFDLDDQGLISELHAVVAGKKLTAIRTPP
jgi:RNA polymerase sigma-70 factor (ECF subfamily)